MYSDKPFWTVDTMFWTFINEDLANPLFVYYSICKKDFASLNVGSAVPSLTVPVIEDIDILLPSKEIQNRIVTILKSLDDKIKVNRRINDNLEQQAMAIFDKVFPAIASGEDTIGSMITPKRGKGLLSKDAVEGNVPVVAGGLEPSTYHNESNTIAPVITISASGANAGYVNLWHIPVWSSDSSFIDGSMTENVYFWYVMLKKRQKEIFDAQTGSAQPHIYPRHIAEMPLGKFEQPDVDKFTEIVTPMFEIRGKNMKESERLASIRDSLLPKLMSGELKLENVNM
jgi:type I restriction enzyme S subunit